MFGVKIAGFVSGNGRRYTEECFREAVSLYENVIVNIDHQYDSDKDVRVIRRFGRLKNVRLDRDGIRGDLHYNPHHPYAEMILHFAENDPSAIGLSHDAEGRKRIENGEVIIEAITQVNSVDIVGNPATTSGLFEEMQVDELDMVDTPPVEMDAPPVDDAGGGMIEKLASLVSDIVKDSSLDTKAKLKKIKMALKMIEEESGMEDMTDETPVEVEEEYDMGEEEMDDEKAMESLKKSKSEVAKYVAKRLESIKLAESRNKKLAERRERCKAAKLAQSAITDDLVESLADLSDAKADKLIESLKKISVNAPKTSVPEQPKSSKPSVRDLVDELAKSVGGGR